MPDLAPLPVFRRSEHVGSDRPLTVLGYDQVTAGAMHGHDYIEIQIVTSGSGVHQGIKTQCKVRRGDVMVMRPGSVHAYAKARQLSVFVLCLSPEFLRNDLSIVLNDPRLTRLLQGLPSGPEADVQPVVRLTTAALARAVPALESLARLRRQPWVPTRLKQIGLLVLLLHEIVVDIPVPTSDASSQGVVHPAVNRVVGMLEADLARAWTMPPLAKAARISEAYLSRLFKQHVGAPPMAYLARLRAERAASLLRTHRTIQEIASDVGWPEPSYFARRFRQHIGVSARTYRQHLTGHG